jgi:hypothetical protein
VLYGSESWVWQKKHTSTVNAVEMRALRGMAGVKLSDRVRNEIIREEISYVKEDEVCKSEQYMLRWFGHVESIDEKRLTKEICEQDLGGNAGRGRPRRAYLTKLEKF